MPEEFSGYSDTTDLPPLSEIEHAFDPASSELAVDDGIRREESIVDLLKFGVPSVAAGFADTVLQSVGITDEGELAQGLDFVNKNLGLFYRRNQATSQTVGDLAGLFIPGTLGLKAYTTVSNLSKGVDLGKRATPVLHALLRNKGRADNLLHQIRERDKLLASAGNVDFLKDQTRRGLANKLRITKAADVVKETLAFELGLLATMNESQTLYPDEFTVVELAALNAVVPSVFAGAVVAQANRSIRSSAQSVANDAIKALNPEAFPVNLTAPRPGTRDYVITVDALTAAAARESAKTFTGADDLAAKTNFGAADQVLMNEAKGQVERLQRDSILNIGTPKNRLTKSAPPNDKITANAMNVLQDDQLALMGTLSIDPLPTAKELAARPANRVKNSKQIDKDIADIRKKYGEDSIPLEEARRIEKLEAQKVLVRSSQDFILETNGDVVLAQGRYSLFQDQDNFLKRVKVMPKSQSADKRFRADVGKRSVQFSDTGVLTITRQAGDAGVAGFPATSKARPLSNFSQLNYTERSAVYASIQKAVNQFDFDKTKINLAFNDHHLRHDYVLSLHEKYGDQIWNNVRLQGNVASLDGIKLASLNSKFNEYAELRKLVDEHAGRLNVPEDRILTMQDIGRMLNLPVSQDGDLTPVLKMFEDLYQENGTMELAARFVTYDNIKRLAQDSTTFPELVGFLNRDVAVMGNMMKFNSDFAPALLVKKPVSETMFSRQIFINEAQVQRAVILKELNEASKNGADLVQLVVDKLNGLNATRVAQQTDTVVEGTQRARGSIAQQSFSAGEVPAVQAAKTTEIETDKPYRQAVGSLFEQLPSGIKYNQLTAKLRGDKGEQEVFNLYMHARRQAWDLEPGVVEAQSGKFFYKLSPKSAQNQKLWERHFGGEMPADALMPVPSAMRADGKRDYAPLAVTGLVRDVAAGVAELDAIVRTNTNHLKRVAGQGPLNFKEHHVPPINFTGQDTGFLITSTGELHSVVAGRSASEMRKIADQEIAASKGNLHFVSRKDTERYFDLHDKAFERMLDLSDPINQTGRATGKSVGGVIATGTGVLDDVIATQQRQLESILRRTRAAYFEPQIRHIKKLMQIGQPEATRRGQSIYNQYLASIFGNPTLNPNDLIGQTYMTAENIFDVILAKVFDKATGVKQALGATGIKQADKRFQELDKTLGEHNPFKNTLDFMERTHDLKIPLRLKPILGRTNSVTTAMTLRLFEVGHSVLTLTSLGATIPAVVNSMRRLPGESVEQHGARVGHFGIKVDDDHAMFSANRAIITTVHDMFNDPAMKGVWRRAADQGYMDQQVAEIYRTLVAPHSGYAQNIAHRSVEMVSMLTDKTEKLARGLSFMVGYNIARKLGKMTDETNLFAAGHHFANLVIGDFSPNNRPRIVQGAAGMPFGLFMTFMTNYYQRLFSYIETKDMRALATQFATQASVYGAESVPGFDVFSETFATNYDGTANLIDGLENRFGRNGAEWFLNGAISNLPKLLGADTGVDLTSRGDVNIRNFPGMGLPAPAQFIATTYQGISEAVKSFRESGTSDQRIAEIISNYGTNRFFRNMGLLYNATVNEAPEVTDRRGAVINQDVFDEMSIVARLMSLRPLNETSNMGVMRRIRNTELSRRARSADLRKNFRASVRQGTIEEDLPGFVRDHIKYGGSPDGIAEVILNNAMAAKVDKTHLELLDVLNSTTRGFDLLRLMRHVDTQQLEGER